MSYRYAHFDVLICQMYLQYMESLLILLCLLFFGYFHTLLMTIHVWIVISPPNFHRLCVLFMYTFLVNMPNITVNYGRFSDLKCFLFLVFSYIVTNWTSSNFYKLCVKLRIKNLLTIKSDYRSWNDSFWKCYLINKKVYLISNLKIQKNSFKFFCFELF